MTQKRLLAIQLMNARALRALQSELAPFCGELLLHGLERDPITQHGCAFSAQQVDVIGSFQTGQSLNEDQGPFTSVGPNQGQPELFSRHVFSPGLAGPDSWLGRGPLNLDRSVFLTAQLIAGAQPRKAVASPTPAVPQ